MSEEIENKPAALPEEGQEIDPLIEQLKEKDDRLQRSLADIDNYKKRMAADQEQFVKFANAEIVKEIVPALDGFQRAIDLAEADKDDNLIKGLALIKRQILDGLAKFGVSEIDAVGKHYDPNLHEAIMKKESKEPEDTILEEVEKGYIMHGRVIRPSMVIVSKTRLRPSDFGGQEGEK